MTDKLRVGVAGAAGRGKGFKAGLTANDVEIRAVCDIRAEALDEAAALTGEMFLQALAGPSEDLRKRTETLLEILNDAINQYRAGKPAGHGGTRPSVSLG